MPADPPRPPALRASDADRDRVIELLRAAAADGRIDTRWLAPGPPPGGTARYVST